MEISPLFYNFILECSSTHNECFTYFDQQEVNNNNWDRERTIEYGFALKFITRMQFLAVFMRSHSSIHFSRLTFSIDRLHCMKYSPVVSFHVTLTPLNSECWSQKRIEIKRTRTIAKRRENATQKLNESNSTVFKWYPNAYVLETENDNNFAVSNLKEQKLIKVSNDIAE